MNIVRNNAGDGRPALAAAEACEPLPDWSQLVGNQKLFELALAAARKSRLSCFDTCIGLGCPHLCPPTMVPLLAYCYAAGVYGSQEIEERFYEDGYVRALCGDKVADAARIRCFRRLHRPLLQQGLTDLVAETRRQLSRGSTAESGAGGKGSANLPDTAVCEREAAERINQAIQMDCMDLDA